MTTAQVVETSVTVNNNSPIQDYVHPDDQTQPTFEMTPGFKPFTVVQNVIKNSSYAICSYSSLKKLDYVPLYTFCKSSFDIQRRAFEVTLHFSSSVRQDSPDYECP